MSRASLHETGRPADDGRDDIRAGQPGAVVSMSASADVCASRLPGTLSCHVTTVTAVVAAITFSASGAAPTPLYHEYQEHFGLTPFMITIIFSAYVSIASDGHGGTLITDPPANQQQLLPQPVA